MMPPGNDHPVHHHRRRLNVNDDDVPVVREVERKGPPPGVFAGFAPNPVYPPMPPSLYCPRHHPFGIHQEHPPHYLQEQYPRWKRPLPIRRRHGQVPRTGVYLAQGPAQSIGQRRMVRGRDGQEISVFMRERSQVGKGTFGKIVDTVVKAHGRKTERLALKVTKPGEEDLGVLEANILLQLKHQNVIGLKYYYEANGAVNLLMEMIDDGDLYHLIHQQYQPATGLGVYTELFAFQMFRGLAYIHTLGIAHRDIKPENILVSMVSGLVKIADFNCATKLSEKNEHSPKVGTKIYNAPELSLGSRLYNEKVDIWSAGVVMTAMICRRSIFLLGVTERDRIEPFDRVLEYLGSPTINDFDCMKIRPEDRSKCPSVSKVRSFHQAFGKAPGINDRKSLMDLIPHIFTYKVHKRFSAYQVMTHNMFGILRKNQQHLPNGNPFPNVFDFADQEHQVLDLGSHVSMMYAR